MAINPAGNRIYMPDGEDSYDNVWSVIAAHTGNVIGLIRGGKSPHETIAYTTGTGVLGFQVSSITTGGVLYTVGFGPRFRRDINSAGTPSHGISLTPNERQLWVMDWPHHYVHVFDVSAVPQRPPREIANIKLVHTNGDGWIQMSHNGCYVYVGDSGDVLSTKTFKPIAYLPALANTKESLEIDWRHGLPVATSTRTGVGYVTRGPDPPPPPCN